MIFNRSLAALVFLFAALLSGCAGQTSEAQPSRQDAVQAVRDFIAVRGLEELTELKSSSSDAWEAIGEHFLIYTGRRNTYLIEFAHQCYEIDDNTRIVPDERWSGNTIRARFDTIRGCRIATFYEVTDEQVKELKNLGDAPGEEVFLPDNDD